MSSKLIADSLGQIGGTILWMIIGFALIESVVFVTGKTLLKKKNTIVAMLVLPAVVGLLILIVYPLVYEFVLAFSNMNLYHFKNPTFSLENGWNNLVRIFTKPVLKQATFFPVFFRTILWTIIQVVFHSSFGMLLALALNIEGLRGKNIYKSFLILPWAMPQVIACLAWRGEFHYEFGFINIMLNNIGLNPIQWKADPLMNFIAFNLTNIWLGIPFMMVIALGGLQGIDRAYYEAAEIDGASGFAKFRFITFPLLKPVMAPAIMLGVIWTFNNFNVPFFINEMKLESSEILVTALFRAAFAYNQYGFAAAFAIVIFIILLTMTVLYMRATGALKGVKE